MTVSKAKVRARCKRLSVNQFVLQQNLHFTLQNFAGVKFCHEPWLRSAAQKGLLPWGERTQLEDFAAGGSIANSIDLESLDEQDFDI